MDKKGLFGKISTFYFNGKCEFIGRLIMNNKGKSMDNKEEIMVSVFCTAYNHGKYIRDCLEGFVKQKTNFKFEVLINDDASTDNTASIIREYEKKYPDIIKPIYQKENQYSKGISIYRQILVPEASGGG